MKKETFEKLLSILIVIGMVLIILTTLFLGSGCEQQKACPVFKWQKITDYELTGFHKLPSGANFRNSKTFAVDESFINYVVVQTLNCLGVADEVKNVYIYVPDDQYFSQCSGRLLFACDVPDFLCKQKDLEPTEECPCACRGAIQDFAIIQHSNLETLRLELVRFFTGFANLDPDDDFYHCHTN